MQNGAPHRDRRGGRKGPSLPAGASAASFRRGPQGTPFGSAAEAGSGRIDVCRPLRFAIAALAGRRRPHALAASLAARGCG